jgi:sulfate adenylyltransferase
MDVVAQSTRAKDLARELAHWPSLTLDERQLQTLELLLDGSLAPIDGFMTASQWRDCDAHARLADGTFWPTPIVLEIAAPAAAPLQPGTHVALRDAEGTPLAVLHVSDRWTASDAGTAEASAGAADAPVRLGGRVEAVRRRPVADFRDLRRPAPEVARDVAASAWPAAVGFYIDRFPLRPAIDAARRAADAVGGGLVVLAGLGVPGPIDHRHYARVRAYRAALADGRPERQLLTLLPAALPAGPQGAALAAIVARNHGCTHVVTAEDVRPVLERAGVDAAAVGVTLLHVPATGDGPSDDEIERRLGSGGALPETLVLPGVARELRRLFPPRGARGLTLFFTGFSGSGKSTIANAVRARLLDRGDRRVTLLDGDLVRRHLSSELGFSRAHRDLNIRRIGFVAAEITRHGGIAICAPIAPYAATRRDVRAAVEAVGDFVLVFVDTPLEECMTRDPKGLYARARAGLIPEFTGVSDPYETPSDAEIVLRTTGVSVDDAAAAVVHHLEREGYLRAVDQS